MVGGGGRMCGWRVVGTGEGVGAAGDGDRAEWAQVGGMGTRTFLAFPKSSIHPDIQDLGRRDT